MQKANVNGILNMDKPVGKTSHQVVAQVRRVSGVRRVGHVGTLDPAASGVLPVCLGQATRVIQFLESQKKTYRAEIEMGTSTDTYDAEGQIVDRGDASVLTREQIEEKLHRFRGCIEQMPPMYSALKYQGTPIYRLARRGLEIERSKRRVVVYRLDFLEWRSPVLTIEVECSKGTYIRSLAHDIGQSLGCGAHLRRLIRLRNGMFDIGDSITVDEMEDAFQKDYWQALIYPLDVILLGWSAIIVGSDKEAAIRNGRSISLNEPDPTANEERTSSLLRTNGVKEGERGCRAYSLGGIIVGLLRQLPGQGLWHPFKVFSTEEYG